MVVIRLRGPAVIRYRRSVEFKFGRQERVDSIVIAKRFREALPDLAAEVEALLRQEGKSTLADQVDVVELVDRCRCGDWFCATAYTVEKPQGAWGLGHESIALPSDHGELVVDVVNDQIVCIEALFREDARQRLLELFP